MDYVKEQGIILFIYKKQTAFQIEGLSVYIIRWKIEIYMFSFQSCVK